MKHRFWVVTTLFILLAGGVILAGVLIETELVWGLGLALLLCILIITPVLAIRSKRLGRYDESQALVRWSYSPEETKTVAQDVLAWQRQRNRWLVPFTAGCLIILGGILAAVFHEQFPETPLWQWLLLLLPALLPWVVRALYNVYLRSIILREPCETVIGRDFLRWGNTRPVFNEREALKLAAADIVEENGASYVRVLYRSIGRVRYGGKVQYRDYVLLLVPRSCENEARALIDVIRKGKNQK